MILKILSEAKEPKQVEDRKLTADEEAIFSEAKKDFGQYRNDTLIELYDLFKDEELGDEVSFAEWLHNNSPLANIIFEFYDRIKTNGGRRSKGEISVHCIRDLLANDELLKRAFWNLAIYLEDVDAEGRENITRRDPATGELLLGDETTPEQVAEDAFLLFTPKNEPERSKYLHDYTDALKKEYVKLGGKLIECLTEEVEEQTEIVSPEVNETPEETEAQEIKVEETAPELSEAIFTDMINSAIQKQWEVIGNLNTIIATFDYDYKESNKEDILSILNQLVDDNTISVGMLYKVSELVSTKTTDLVDSGQQKAEDIISAE